VAKKGRPAEVIEINARLYSVKEFYIEEIVKNIMLDHQIEKSAQDKELMSEVMGISELCKPQVKECNMRVAAYIICDVIEKNNAFKDPPGEKGSILVFLPGLHEIFEFVDFIYECYGTQFVKQFLEIIPLHSSLCEYLR
jgi:HrpA-like RNA helicase